MTTISDIFNKSLKQVKSNSPAILTGLGIAGVVSTAYLTAIASFKASGKLDEEQLSNAWGHINTKERLKKQIPLVWKFYIPPAISGVATVACIIGAATIDDEHTRYPVNCGQGAIDIFLFVICQNQGGQFILERRTHAIAFK